jgi:arylsulfatase A-like enzyme
MFVSDHGEMLYDHNMFGKACPYDGSARIPFMISLPEDRGRREAMNSAVPVELRDVMPTLLEAAGAPIPGSVEGRSVLPFCRGETPEWRRYLHGEHTRGSLSNHWITDGREVYVWFSQTGNEQLFDLTTDPRNEWNLAARQPARVEFWRACLVRELEGREEGFVRDGSLVVGREVTPILGCLRDR